MPRGAEERRGVVDAPLEELEHLPRREHDAGDAPLPLGVERAVAQDELGRRLPVDEERRVVRDAAVDRAAAAVRAPERRARDQRHGPRGHERREEVAARREGVDALVRALGGRVGADARQRHGQRARRRELRQPAALALVEQLPVGARVRQGEALEHRAEGEGPAQAVGDAVGPGHKKKGLDAWMRFAERARAEQSR